MDARALLARFGGLQVLRQGEAVGAILVVARHTPELAKPVLFIERTRPLVRHFHHEPDPCNPAPPQTAQRAVHEGGRRTFAEEGRIHRQRDQFGPIPVLPGEMAAIEYAHTFVPRSATRNRPPHLRVYSANRLRSYAYAPKLAASF